jgi:hypothetical protein
MVKVAFALVPVNAASGTDALKLPLPAIPPVRVAVPVSVNAVLETASVAVTDSVALVVAACAAAQINKVVRTRSMGLLLSWRAGNRFSDMFPPPNGTPPADIGSSE